MNLVSIRVITADVQQLIAFYEQVTGLTATVYTEDFAEFRSPAATLAIGSIRTLRFFSGDDVAAAAANRSAIIEFKVADVDDAYARLADLLQPLLVQPPTTMPWGNRSMLFRDPDGNLVNFFTPVTPETRTKFEGKYAMPID